MACRHDAWFSWCANAIPAGCSKVISWSRRCATCGMRETTFHEPVEYDLPPEILPISDVPADVVVECPCGCHWNPEHHDKCPECANGFERPN